MVAVATNVVVRLLTADDPKQTQIAARLFEQETIFLSRTVLLETAWVLRSTYDLSSNTVVDAIAGLLGLDGVVVEDRDKVADAVELARNGVDFADGLHIVASPPEAEFATFDRALRNAAGRAGSFIPLRAP